MGRNQQKGSVKMVATIVRLWRYPFKGTQGLEEKMLTIDAGIGIIGDRRFGVRREAGPNEWASKRNFYVCMNEPKMALEKPEYEYDVAGNILRPTAEYLAGLKARLGIEGELMLQDTEGQFDLSDTRPGSHVSICNMATLREFSQFYGEQVDLRRFRMNIYVEGLQPFEEYEWVPAYPGKHIIELGDVTLRVDDVCERCPAIMADPLNGHRDEKLFTALTEFMCLRGYKSPHRQISAVMGVLAAPINDMLSSGNIRANDTVELIA